MKLIRREKEKKRKNKERKNKERKKKERMNNVKKITERRREVG